MKATFILILSAFLFVSPQSEKNYPEVAFCHSTEEFKAFADNKDFLLAHELSATVNFEITKGEMVTFKAEGGPDANAFLIQPDEPSGKWLFVIHEWWGLNDHIKAESEKYFDALGDVNVLALDLYDGKVATTREDAANYMKATETFRLKSIIYSAYIYAGIESKFASVGWCFGGGWSLQSAILGRNMNEACVMYYGMPEKDLGNLEGITADVLGIFAENEEWITPEIVSEFEANMNKLNKSITIKSYDAEHAFANPSRPAYKKEYADEAFQLTVDFIKERL